MISNAGNEEAGRKSTSSWGRELKCAFIVFLYNLRWSTSSWGRELKYNNRLRNETSGQGRPLREVVSWNFLSCGFFFTFSRRPLREVVSWNYNVYTGNYSRRKVDLFVRSWVEILYHVGGVKASKSRPLREVVSWNGLGYRYSSPSNRRPLREVVSWNALKSREEIIQEMSTSSWGRELKW